MSGGSHAVPRDWPKAIILLLALLSSATVWADPPSKPAGLRYTAFSSTTTEILWERSTDNVIVVGYELEFDGMRLQGVRDQLTLMLNNLQLGQQYPFSVTAVDNEGNRSETASIVIIAGESRDADVGDTIVDPPVSPLAPPANLRFQVYSSRAAEVFWDRVPDAAVSYIVYLDDEELARTDAVSYFLDALEGGRNYTISVRAVSNDGRQSESVAVTATTRLSDSQLRAVEAAINALLIDARPAVERPDVVPPVAEPPASEPDGGLQPDRSIYSADGYGTANVIRLDVKTFTTPGECSAQDDSGCTLADVINDIDKTDDLTVDIDVAVKTSDGFDYPDFDNAPNAQLRQRGGGSRAAPQKSFRIRLDSKKDLWRDERFWQLNKHPYDSTRQRNKLAMDLMSRVPHLPSLRTQFVNLWIDDGNGPVDYGLFTHVERPNDDYLKRRGLDGDGNLYKASTFRFLKEDLAVLTLDEEGRAVDKDRFETALEIEEGKDHRPLVNMLSALHDSNRSFDDVLQQYFDPDNVLAWMSVNLILNQWDATRHNYMLYNPSDSEKFYFIPWDYDATMGSWELPPNDSFSDRDMRNRIEYGYALGAKNHFIEQFLKLPGMHDKLVQATQSLRQNYLDDTTVQLLSSQNARLIAPFQAPGMPDYNGNQNYNPYPSFVKNLRDNDLAVREAFSVPIPPRLLSPQVSDAGLLIRWDPAVDITGNQVTYDLQVATDSAFRPEQLLQQMVGMSHDTLSAMVNATSLGATDAPLYFRLIARSTRDPQRFWVPARNYLLSSDTAAADQVGRRYGVIRYPAN